MLRPASQRLMLSLSRPSLARPLSSTAQLSIRVKHADGSKTSPSTDTAGSSKPPSPAPAPSSPPPKTTTPRSADPVVNKASDAAPHPAPSSGPVTPPRQPQSTPAPKPAAVPETPAESVEEPSDFSKLPSLDVDSEMARLADPEPEPAQKEGAAGASGTGPKARRTGAGRKEYATSVEKQRRAMLRYGIGALVLGGVAAAYFTEGEKVQKEGEAAVGGFERLKNNASEFLDVSRARPAVWKYLTWVQEGETYGRSSTNQRLRRFCRTRCRPPISDRTRS